MSDYDTTELHETMTLKLNLTRRLRSAVAGAAVLAALAAPASAPAAEAFYGATSKDVLVKFHSDSPGALRMSERIKGLAVGEDVVGMDMRPATGQLYGLTNKGRLLVINMGSGETKTVNTTPIVLQGTSFGFDFNPVADRIRITSDADQNLRVNPDTGEVTVDTNLAYRAGDAGAGTNPSVGGVAYTNSVFGGPVPTTTTLLGIDSQRDVLVEQTPPNEGTLVTRGALGVNAAEPVHFDISGRQTGYAAFARTGTTGMELFAINFTTGKATRAAKFPRLAVPNLTAMAAVGAVLDDRRGPRIGFGNYTAERDLLIRRGLRLEVSCNETCVAAVEMRAGRRLMGRTVVEFTEANTRQVRVQLNRFGQRLVRNVNDKRRRTLIITARDAAGNVTTRSTTFFVTD